MSFLGELVEQYFSNFLIHLFCFAYYFLGTSAFGHLDGIHATIRSSTQMVAVSDAHIRFERSTEAKAKSPLVVEEVDSHLCIFYVCQHNFAFYSCFGVPSKSSIWLECLQQLEN